MKALTILAVLVLTGCATAQPEPASKSVVILGNKTVPAVCECPAATLERTRAEHWKAYAEKLETALGLPHDAEAKH